MDIIYLLERLERYILEDSPKFIGNRTVNEEEVRQHLQRLRDAIPQEIAEAKKIIDQHQVVLDAAQAEAEQILAEARYTKPPGPRIPGSNPQGRIQESPGVPGNQPVRSFLLKCSPVKSPELFPLSPA